MILFDKVPFLDLYMFDSVGISIVCGACLIIGIILGLALKRS